jgi:hypothetical protein
MKRFAANPRDDQKFWQPPRCLPSSPPKARRSAERPRTMRKWLAALGLVVVALGRRSARRRSRRHRSSSRWRRQAGIAVDARAGARERLAGAVRLKTIASTTDRDANAGEFLALQAHLQTSFPKGARSTASRGRRASYALLYTVAGQKIRGRRRIALLAHQDVVPIAPRHRGRLGCPAVLGDGEGRLRRPGLGRLDDKGNLMAMLEAVEMRVAAGFTPRQTIYLAFGSRRGARRHARRAGRSRGCSRSAACACAGQSTRECSSPRTRFPASPSRLR